MQNLFTNIRRIFGAGPIIVGLLFVISLLMIAFKNQILASSYGYWFVNTSFHWIWFSLGVFLVILGAFFWIYSVINSRLVKNILEHKLITTGMFEIVRNPLYTGVWFLNLGLLLVFDFYTSIVILIIYLGFMTVVIKNTEEQWLTNEFGDEYLAYKQRTPRFIPSIITCIRVLFRK